MIDQIIISGVIIATLVFFITGKWRYDVVALLSLFTVAAFGLIPLDDIFLGFVDPVVVLIVAMLVISNALVASGAIDFIAKSLKFTGSNPVFQLVVLSVFTAFLSAFINSMGALAFVIPIAIKMARQSNTPLSLFLMPLAFASHFGGGVTLIGSVSNIVVSGFRAEESVPFGFFDFASVALPISVISIIFIALIGWRLIPKRESALSQEDSFGGYTTEVKIAEGSPVIGKTIEEFYEFCKEHFGVFALIRNESFMPDPSPFTVLKEGDVLALEIGADSLESVAVTAKLELLHKKPIKDSEDYLKNLEITEIVISKSSPLIGETAKDYSLRDSYRVNLLALRRSGLKIRERIGDIKLRSGDVLIIQGHPQRISKFIKRFDLLLLKERDFNFDGKKESAVLASLIFLGAILISVFSTLPVHIIFAGTALLMVAVGLISPLKMYRSVDFSMIVLIAVMIQLGVVFYETGAASSLASLFFLTESISPEIALAIIFIASILLSDILSNITVAILLAPVALSIANSFGVSPDPFFIAVAIGSGSSYLTPIGHQSNIFVMGIGGYKFKDYWRLGLPLEIITFVVGFFLILHFWPF
ncbi:MAG: anion permease [Candidatus Pacebacteria bacterium]|nr:anion permease [Candidatus Paceibacterota bacterium]